MLGGDRAAAAGDSLLGALLRWLAGLALQLRALLRRARALLFARVAVVNGRALRLRRLVAEGGCGLVYLATDAAGRRYALKQVLSDAPEGRAAAREEAAAHRAALHENVMPLADAGFERRADGKEVASLVFPLFEAGSAQDAIGRALEAFASAPPPLPHSAAPKAAAAPNAAAAAAAAAAHARAFTEAAVLALGLGVARGLQALHASGRAHRDVCPRNVMLRGSAPPSSLPVAALAPSAAVLTDLGSCAPARLRIATRTDALRLVEEAATKSSMPYRAPELFSCDPGDEVSADLSDCFSLGATLFACAFGLSPFESSRGDDGRLRVAEPSHLRTLGAVAFPAQHAFSPAFCALLLRMLEKDPGKRMPLAAAAGEMERILFEGGAGAVVVVR